MPVTQAITVKQAEALAQFARVKYAPGLSAWYCGGYPYLLETQLAALAADPDRCILVARNSGRAIIGYTIVRRSDQFCETFCPDPANAEEAFTLLVEECCKQFPNMWGHAISPEFSLFLTVKVSRKVVFEPPDIYRIVDP